MKRQEIIDTVNAIVADKAGIEASDIRPDDFYDELGTDSIQCIEVLMEIEKEFAIDIPSWRLIQVSTMQHVYDLVEQVLSETQEYIDSILNQTA